MGNELFDKLQTDFNEITNRIAKEADRNRIKELREQQKKISEQIQELIDKEHDKKE